MKKSRLHLLSRMIGGVVLLAMLAGLSACGGGGGSSTPPNADPTGYYSNTGSMSTLGISDLQAMFYNGKVTLFSQSKGYGFAGSYTVSGNTISGNVREYDVIDLGSESDTGTFTATFNTADHSISGTITRNKLVPMSVGFSLNYASGRSASTVAAIVKTGGGTTWDGTFMNDTHDVLTVNITNNTAYANLTTVTKINDGFADYTDLDACDVSGTLTPVTGSLYDVSLTLSSCSQLAINSNGYTGLAALNGGTLFITVDGKKIGGYQGIFGVFK